MIEILTDYWQSNWILTDNRQVDPLIQTLEISLRVLKYISRVSAAKDWNIFFNTKKEISYLDAAM